LKIKYRRLHRISNKINSGLFIKSNIRNLNIPGSYFLDIFQCNQILFFNYVKVNLRLKETNNEGTSFLINFYNRNGYFTYHFNLDEFAITLSCPLYVNFSELWRNLFEHLFIYINSYFFVFHIFNKLTHTLCKHLRSSVLC